MPGSGKHPSLIFILEKSKITLFKAKKLFIGPRQPNPQKRGLNAKRGVFCKALIVSVLGKF